MMDVRLFEPEKDAETVNEWAQEHGYNFEPSYQPETAWIVPDVAYACVYTTNQPKLAFLDHLLSNPKTDKELRDEGLQVLLKHIEKVTAAAGIERVVMYTAVPAVLERGLKHFTSSVNKASYKAMFVYPKASK